MKEWAVGFPLMPDQGGSLPQMERWVEAGGGRWEMGQDVTERGRTKHEQLRWNEEKGELEQTQPSCDNPENVNGKLFLEIAIS